MTAFRTAFTPTPPEEVLKQLGGEVATTIEQNNAGALLRIRVDDEYKSAKHNRESAVREKEKCDDDVMRMKTYLWLT